MAAAAANFEQTSSISDRRPGSHSWDEANTRSAGCGIRSHQTVVEPDVPFWVPRGVNPPGEDIGIDSVEGTHTGSSTTTILAGGPVLPRCCRDVPAERLPASTRPLMMHDVCDRPPSHREATSSQASSSSVQIAALRM